MKKVLILSEKEGVPMMTAMTIMRDRFFCSSSQAGALGLAEIGGNWRTTETFMSDVAKATIQDRIMSLNNILTSIT